VKESKKKIIAELQERRKPMRLMSKVHLLALSPGQLCGCPQCLLNAGIEAVEVYDIVQDKFRMMLVDWFSPQALSRVKRETEKLDFEGTPNEEE
jgi:hypothetical protein